MTLRHTHFARIVLPCVGLALAACGGATTSTSPSPTTRPTSAGAPARLPREDAPAIARAVDDELSALLATSGVRSARIVVLSVDRASILAADARDASGAHPELATDEVRSHGSTAKLFPLAAVLEDDLASLAERFDGAPLDRDGMHIADAIAHATLSIEDIVAFSSNVGTTHLFDRVGPARLASTLDRFGLAARVPAELRADHAPTTHDAQLAYGGLEATALEVASAYLVVARHGLDASGHAVVSRGTADELTALFEASVTREDGTGHRAAIEGVRVAGKTGTVPLEGGTFGVFVGFLPAEAPTHVVLVAAETDGTDYTGGSLAAPSFARLAPRILAAH